jgi:hypothetical protein
LNAEDHPEIPSPKSFRRTLVLGVDLGLLLLIIIIANAILEYFHTVNSISTGSSFPLLLFGFWGISYIIYLWISFLLIAVKRIPGCEFTAVGHWLLNRNIHVCVDSILNSRLDILQQQVGLSLKLLQTESAQKWILGLVLLFALVYFLSLNTIDPPVKLFVAGIFSLIYFLYDITIHKFSINKKDLSGRGDYPRLILQFVIAMVKKTILKSRE